MAISGIGSIMNAIGLSQPSSATAATQAANITDPSVAAPTNAAGNSFTNILDGLQATQGNADNLAVQAATGNLTDIHNYTIAATEATLATDLTVAVRDRAVQAFNDIMGMQV
jgi:flagellar hook-basal body complex protein FliE